MISSSFLSHRPLSMLEAFSETVSLARVGPAGRHGIADASYFQRVIAHSEFASKERGIGLGELTRRAGLKKGVVGRSERQGVIPGILEFKAWARALVLPWDVVWSASFPAQVSLEL